jgi:protein-tyrosine phosphatase
MTNSHKAAIAANFPDAAQKTFTLKEFVGEDKNLDVSDPYGGDIVIYRETFKEIEKLIEKAIMRITT